MTRAGSDALSLTSFTAYVGAVLGIISILLQLLHTMRSRDTEGMSVTTWVLMLGMNGLWTEYCIARHLLAGWISDGTLVLLIVGIMVLLSRLKVPRALSGMALCAIGWSAMWAVSRLSLVYLIAAITVLECVTLLPQLREVIRNDDPTGVSSWSWLLSAACSSTWLVYGVLVGSTFIVTVQIVWIPLASTIGARSALARRPATADAV